MGVCVWRGWGSGPGMGKVGGTKDSRRMEILGGGFAKAQFSPGPQSRMGFLVLIPIIAGILFIIIGLLHWRCESGIGLGDGRFSWGEVGQRPKEVKERAQGEVSLS